MLQHTAGKLKPYCDITQNGKKSSTRNTLGVGPDNESQILCSAFELALYNAASWTPPNVQTNLPVKDTLFPVFFWFL